MQSIRKRLLAATKRLPESPNVAAEPAPTRAPMQPPHSNYDSIIRMQLFFIAVIFQRLKFGPTFLYKL